MNKFLTVIVWLTFLILGVFFLANPIAGLLSLTMYIAILSLMAWLVFIIISLTIPQARWILLISWIINIILWIVLLTYPIDSATLLIIILWIWVAILGISLFGMSFDLKTHHIKGRWWAMIFGILISWFGICTVFNPLFFGTILAIVLWINFIMYSTWLFISLFRHTSTLKSK